jgi:hypothetical protein
MAKRERKLRKMVDDLGIEISTSDDAMFAIGRLDALASVLSQRYKLVSRKAAVSAPAVLRNLAKKQPTRRWSLLRRAASRATTLEGIARTAYYGDLPPDQIGLAEDTRSELYDLLDKWVSEVEP